MGSRVIIETYFTKDWLSYLQLARPPLERTDFVADYTDDSFAIVVDAHSKLGWQSAYLGTDPVTALLSEQVSNEYLAYLRRQGASYLSSEPTEIDLRGCSAL